MTPAFLAEICTWLAESGVTASSSGLLTCTRGMFLSSVRMRLVLVVSSSLSLGAADLVDQLTATGDLLREPEAMPPGQIVSIDETTVTTAARNAERGRER